MQSGPCMVEMSREQEITLQCSRDFFDVPVRIVIVAGDDGFGVVHDFPDAAQMVECCEIITCVWPGDHFKPVVEEAFDHGVIFTVPLLDDGHSVPEKSTMIDDRIGGIFLDDSHPSSQPVIGELRFSACGIMDGDKLVVGVPIVGGDLGSGGATG